MAKISQIAYDNDTLTFKISNANNSIVNALRRVLIAEIPTLAFSNINVETNISPFSAEYISQRISLIPLRNNLIKDSSKEFVLDVRGPKNGYRKVYSDEIKPQGITQSGIVIAVLKGLEDKQEHLRITMKLAKGTHANKDASHSAVTIASYKQINSETFDFIVESRGVMNLKDLMKIAFDVLNQKFNLVLTSINEPKTTKLSWSDNSITIYEEDDTLGNLIQTILMPKVSFVSYNKPHPLEHKIIMIIKDPNAKELFIQALQDLIKVFERLHKFFK